MLQRFFIAILPPPSLRQEVEEIKYYFAKVYHSQKALNSPPHITLKAPFQWESENLPALEQTLQEFAALNAPVAIALSGFGAFKPRVIFLRPLPNPELSRLQHNLRLHLARSFNLLDRETRDFNPHLTVAFRDLTPANFQRAWLEFKTRSFEVQFVATELSLLIHTGNQWEVCRDFPLQLTEKVINEN